jgi:hypothetical protein
MANAPKEPAAGSAGACWRCVKHRNQASQIAWDGLRRYHATLDAVEAPLDLCVKDAGARRRRDPASISTRPQGGVVTEWYGIKGKHTSPFRGKSKLRFAVLACFSSSGLRFLFDKVGANSDLAFFLCLSRICRRQCAPRVSAATKPWPSARAVPVLPASRAHFAPRWQSKAPSPRLDFPTRVAI